MVRTLTLLTLVAGLLVGQQAVFDQLELERTEDLSESLANDLLRLSVATRDRDAAGIAPHWADEVEIAGFFDGPSATEVLHSWLGTHDWQGSGVKRVTRTELLRRFTALLDHFDSIDDARFKVKRATFREGDDRGTARIEFTIVGRDRAGQREWMVALVEIEAERISEEDWQIVSFAVESAQSKVASRDLFDEVAVPAGVGARFPDFGTAPNDSVVAHGVAVADINNDGLMDVLATGVEGNSLYLNEGDGTFRDISEETLVGLTPTASGAVFFDADNDGDQDLFLSAVGTQMFLENRLIPDGVLAFLDISPTAGVARTAIGFSPAVADVNGDGLLDIYVTSYNQYGVVMPDSWHDARNGTPNLLFLNQGGLKFREAAAEWGVRDTRWSYAAAFADVDGDGDPDLYVANDFGHNALYENVGGRFVDVAAERGVLDPGNGMGVSFGDFQNDGHLDLHVTNMSSTAGNRILARLFPEQGGGDPLLRKLAAGNTLFLGDGEGNFVDITQDLGGIAAGWAWGGGFFDFDNDGWEDVYAPNGFISGKSMNDT